MDKALTQLITPRLVLREFRPDDFADFRAWDGDPEVQRYELGRAANEAESRFFFNQILRTNQETPRLHWRFAVTRRLEDRAIGRISLSVSDDRIHEYEIGWAVRRDLWGQGLATEAAQAVLGVAFSQLNAHRVVAFCHIDNLASQAVMRKLGMSPEGCFREALWINNQWWDELSFAILDREFTRSNP